MESVVRTRKGFWHRSPPPDVPDDAARDYLVQITLLFYGVEPSASAWAPRLPTAYMIGEADPERANVRARLGFQSWAASWASPLEEHWANLDESFASCRPDLLALANASDDRRLEVGIAPLATPFDAVTLPGSLLEAVARYDVELKVWLAHDPEEWRTEDLPRAF